MVKGRSESGFYLPYKNLERYTVRNTILKYNV